MRRTLFSFLGFALALTLVGGCIFSPDKEEEQPPQQTPPPANDTPQGAILRFIWAYENKDHTRYVNMFTNDFTFEFSEADPELQNEYATGWFKEDERISSQNLFFGGVNSDGETQPAASSITLTLQSTAPSDDNTEGRDPTLYKTLLTPVRLDIEIGEDTFVVGSGIDVTRHRFFVVRGDAANGLDEDQPADDKHWYIWNWRDEAPPGTGGAPGTLDTDQTGDDAVQVVTWGELKNLRR